MNTFSDALRIVNREFEIFADGERHLLDVMRSWPSHERYANLHRLSDNVLVALQREMPTAGDQLLVIFRDHIIHPLQGLIDRMV